MCKSASKMHKNRVRIEERESSLPPPGERIRSPLPPHIPCLCSPYMPGCLEFECFWAGGMPSRYLSLLQLPGCLWGREVGKKVWGAISTPAASRRQFLTAVKKYSLGCLFQTKFQNIYICLPQTQQQERALLPLLFFTGKMPDACKGKGGRWWKGRHGSCSCHSRTVVPQKCLLFLWILPCLPQLPRHIQCKRKMEKEFHSIRYTGRCLPVGGRRRPRRRVVLWRRAGEACWAFKKGS